MSFPLRSQRLCRVDQSKVASLNWAGEIENSIAAAAAECTKPSSGVCRAAAVRRHPRAEERVGRRARFGESQEQSERRSCAAEAERQYGSTVASCYGNSVDGFWTTSVLTSVLAVAKNDELEVVNSGSSTTGCTTDWWCS